MFKRWRKRSDPEPPVLPEYILDKIGRTYLFSRGSHRGSYGDEESTGRAIVGGFGQRVFASEEDALREALSAVSWLQDAIDDG